MLENYVSVLRKYADFDGRAGQREFWLFFVVNGGLLLLLLAPARLLEGSLLATVTLFLFMVVFLGTVVPFYAVAVRRLHDTGRSGWWILIKFIPYIGGLILIVLLALESQPGPNKHGAGVGRDPPA